MRRSLHPERIPCLLKNLKRNNNQRYANVNIVSQPVKATSVSVLVLYYRTSYIATLRCDLAKGLCLRYFANKLKSSMLVYISVCCPGEVIQQGLCKLLRNSSFPYLPLICLLSLDRASSHLVSFFFHYFFLIFAYFVCGILFFFVQYITSPRF